MNKWSQRTMGLISAILFAVVLSVGNVLLHDQHTRIDLTRDKRFSVSPELRGLLAKLEDVMQITIYVSPDLPPQLLAPRQSSEDLLREISGAAGGKMRLRVIEMTPALQAEMKPELEKNGIAPMQMQVASREGFSVRSVYFHMLVQYREKSQVMNIPRLEEFEYSFARALLKVTQTDRPVVYAVDNEPASEFLRLMQTLERGGLQNLVEVVRIDASNNQSLLLPEKIDLLILSARERLSDGQILELDQYLMYGGTLVVFATGAPFDDPLVFFRTEDKIPNLSDYLANYGIDVSTELVQDWGSSMKSPAKISEKDGVPTYSLDAFPFPILPIIKGENIDEAYPALRQTQRLLMPYATRVTAREGIDKRMVVRQMLWTTDQADFQTTAPYNLEQPKPGAPTPAKVGRIPLALDISGPFRSYFMNHKMPDMEFVTSSDPMVNIRRQTVARRSPRELADPKARIIVLGSAHMFWQNFLEHVSKNDQTLANDSVSFLQNLIETLTVGQELAHVRAKQTRQAFLDSAKVEREQGRARILGTFAVPIFIVLFGALWTIGRRSRLRALARKYAG